MTIKMSCNETNVIKNQFYTYIYSCHAYQDESLEINPHALLNTDCSRILAMVKSDDWTMTTWQYNMHWSTATVSDMISSGVYIHWNHANSYWLVHCSVSKLCIGNHMIHSTGRSFSIASHIAHSLATHAIGIYSVTCPAQWHNYKFYPLHPRQQQASRLLSVNSVNALKLRPFDLRRSIDRSHRSIA